MKKLILSFSIIFLSVASFANDGGSAKNAIKLAKMALNLGDIQEARQHIEDIKNIKLSKKEQKEVKKIDEKIKKSSKKHQIKGKISAGYETHSDIGGAPAPNGGRDITDQIDVEDEDGEDEGFGDDDLGLDDLLEDDSLNDQDLEEIFDEADGDGDGQDDLTDTDIDDDVGGGDGFFSRARDSESRYNQAVNLAHSFLLSEKGHLWNTAGAFVNSFNGDRTELDRRNYAFTTGPSFNIPSLRLRVNPAVSYMNMVRNDQAFSEAFIYSLGFAFKATDNLTLGLKYAYQDRDINAINSPDAEIDSFKLSAAYKITKNDILNFGFAPNFEDSTKFNRNRDTYGYSAGYIRKLPFDMAAGLTFNYRHAELVNISPNRQDDMYNYTFQLGKKFKEGFSVSASLVDQQRKSSIAGKDTRDQAFMLNTGWSF